MATSAYSLKALRQLSVAERIQLVEDLWDSIAEDNPDAAFPITPALAAELDRRLADYERDPSIGEDWAVVRRRIAKQVRQAPTAKPAPRRKK
jgi:putative addiction module component (TIGR02574 family)